MTFIKRKNNPTVERMVVKAFDKYEKAIQKRNKKRKESVHSSEESLLCPLSRSDKSLLM